MHLFDFIVLAIMGLATAAGWLVVYLVSADDAATQRRILRAGSR